MTLDSLLVRLSVVVGLLVFVAAITIVGPDRLKRARDGGLGRLWAVGPYLGLLGGVALTNKFIRSLGEDLSWVIGVNITGRMYAVEGALVASFQSVATPTLTWYLSFMYVYGYVFLLVFPLVAYAVLDDVRFLREMCLAYTFNYLIGLVCYVIFIAYGPRNLIPDLVDPLLYSSWPQSQFLTSQVNANTNVFPSLHASLSVTVLLLAYRTREHYTMWLYVAAGCTVSIVVATMYLGIHWAVDVLAGVTVAFLAVMFVTSPSPRSAPRPGNYPKESDDTVAGPPVIDPKDE